MSDPKERLPRPGHAGDLNEWATKEDAETLASLEAQLEAATDELKARLAEVIDPAQASEELTKELEIRIDNIRRLAATRSSYAMGPKLADFYNGEAFNA